MGSANIRAKIKKGLAKAINKTGSTSSEKVFLIQTTNTGGNTPIDLPVLTETTVELVNAIFREYDKSLIGGNIVSGDRELVSDNDIAIKTGDTIRQGTTNYTVIDLEIKAPTSDVLVYISQLRVK